MSITNRDQIDPFSEIIWSGLK